MLVDDQEERDEDRHAARESGSHNFSYGISTSKTGEKILIFQRFGNEAHALM